MGRARTGIILAAGALALLAAAAPCPASEAETGDGGDITASLSHSEAPVGSLVELTLAYRLPEGGRPTDPLEIGGLEGLAVIHRDERPGTVVVTFLADRLEGWEAEKITLVYVDRGGERNSLETGKVSVAALSNLGERPEEALPRPLRGILPAGSPWLRYAPWAAAAAALLLSSAAVYWWLRRKRPGAAVRPEDPPHVRARREIEHLEARRMFEKGQAKEFYFSLSEIMRRYLENIRSFPAAEYTTEEIARSIQHEEDQVLLALLRKADLVKFADDQPTAARKEEEVRTALAYIGETGPDTESMAPGDAAGRQHR